MAEQNTPPSTGIKIRRTSFSISWKIGIACLAIGVFTTVLTGSVAHFLYRSAVEKAAFEKLDSIRYVVTQSINDYVNDIRQNMRRLGQAPESTLIIGLYSEMATADASLIPSYQETLQNNTAAVLSQAREWRTYQLYYFAKDGSLISSGAPEEGITDINLFGEGLAATSLGELGSKIQKDPTIGIYQHVNENVEISTGSGPRTFPFLYIAVPVSPEGTDLSNPLGYLVAVIVLDELLTLPSMNDNQEDMGLGLKGQAFLVDQTFTVRSSFRSSGNSQDAVGNLKSETKGAKDALSGEPGRGIYKNRFGENTLGSYTPLNIEGMRWALIVEQPQDEALAVINTSLGWVAIIGCIMVALSAVIGYIVAQWLSRPIFSLRGTMEQAAAGNENARAEVLSSDEIGQLANSLNDMIQERNSVKDRISNDNRRLQANIQEFLLVVADASEGKLQVRAKRTEGILGNIADALNRMLNNVGVLIGQAKDASSNVGNAARQMTSSAEELTAGAGRQSEGIADMIKDVEDLTSNSQTVASNSKEAESKAEQARNAAEGGAESVKELIQYMESLRESFEANAQKIRQLGARSREISTILQYISDISAETDVLAMNASIEAARAGEQGKGFTVVADQVRALADRTREATVDIEKLVHGIQTETAEAVQKIEAQTAEVETGTRQVTMTGNSLSKIVKASVDSSALVKEISQAAATQEARSEEILKAMVEINQIAEDAQARTLQFSKLSEQLAQLSEDLDKQLANFDIGASNAVTKEDIEEEIKA